MSSYATIYGDELPIPKRGRSYYLPEMYRLKRMTREEFKRFVIATIDEVVKYADHYEVRNFTHRSILMKSEITRRSKDIRLMMTYLEKLEMSLIDSTCVNLYRSSDYLLNQNDGPPGILSLSPREFTRIQRVWLSNGFNIDMYFHHTLMMTEPDQIRTHEGPRATVKYYTPLEYIAMRRGAQDS